MRNYSQLTREEEDRAVRIHKEAIVVDGLATPIRTKGQFDRMLQGGVDACNWTIIDLDYDLRQTVREISAWYSLFREHHNKITSVTSVEDIMEAKKQNKLGIIFGFQDPTPIILDISVIEALYKLGMRVMGLTYNEKNAIGDGAGEQTDCGLSRFGESVVSEMNRLGILVDLSHSGRKTTTEAAEISKDPVVFTHANARALCKSARNKSDEELALIADKGGVIGAAAWGPMLWSREGQRPTIDDYLNQIDYMVKLVGVDHVGIGLDIEEMFYTGEKGTEDSARFRAKYAPHIIPPWDTDENRYAKDLCSYVQFSNITKGLVGRGYSDQDVKKILGENFLRVLRKVWK